MGAFLEFLIKSFFTVISYSYDSVCCCPFGFYSDDCIDYMSFILSSAAFENDPAPTPPFNPYVFDVCAHSDSPSLNFATVLNLFKVVFVSLYSINWICCSIAWTAVLFRPLVTWDTAWSNLFCLLICLSWLLTCYMKRS